MRMRMLAGIAAILAFGVAGRAEDKKAEKFDAAKVVGGWKITEGTKHGDKVDAKATEGQITWTKDAITIKSGDGMTYAMSYKLDEKASPVAIDMVGTDGPVKGIEAFGIVALDGDTLKLCYALEKAKRPKEFASKKEGDALLFVMKKEKK